MEKKEVFKSIENFPNYEVSNYGNVKSLQYGRERILKPYKSKRGYLRVTLCKQGLNKHMRINRLVALTFIPNPQEKEVVNHVNGEKEDNRVENLEWNTQSENSRHALKTGLSNHLHSTGENCNFAKLKTYEVLQIRDLYKSGRFFQREIAEFYSCSREHVGDIASRRRWKHI